MKLKITAMLVLFYFCSCEKGHVQQYSVKPPVISFVYPGKCAAYNPGDTIFIRATISDELELHSISVRLKDVTISRPLFKIEEHIHVSSYSVDTFYVVPPEAINTKYQFEVYANNHADKSTHHEEILEVIR